MAHYLFACSHDYGVFKIDWAGFSSLDYFLFIFSSAFLALLPHTLNKLSETVCQIHLAANLGGQALISCGGFLAVPGAARLASH